MLPALWKQTLCVFLCHRCALMSELRAPTPPSRKYYSGKYLPMEPEAERSLVQENTALPFFFFFFSALWRNKQYALILKAGMHFQCKISMGIFKSNSFFFFHCLLQWLMHLKSILCSADRARIANFLIVSRGYTCTWPKFQLVTLRNLDLPRGYCCLRNISTRIELVSYS